MVKVDVLLNPVFIGDVWPTISEASLYDNLWLDAEFVTEWTGAADIRRFDEAGFCNDDDAASLSVSTIDPSGQHSPLSYRMMTG